MHKVPHSQKKTKEPIPTPSGATVVFQGVPIRSDLKIISEGYVIHTRPAYLFGNAGTVASFEYGDLGSHEGSIIFTGRC